MLITRTNPFNGTVNTRDLDITEQQVAAYEAGALLQNAFQTFQQTIASSSKLASTTGTRCLERRLKWLFVQSAIQLTKAFGHLSVTPVTHQLVLLSSVSTA